MLHRMSSSTALITGGTAGIGLAFATALAERGHDLILVARDADRLAETATDLANRYGVHAEVLVADLADPDQRRLVEDRLSDTGRPVDLLINNAGFGLKGRFLANDADTEQQMLEVLVTAVLRLSHAALGGMVERGHGGIINVSSVAAFLPRGTYSAAKAWVNSFSEWAATEYRPAGVQVMALCPGFTKTEFHERMGVGRDSAPQFLWLEPDALVARALDDFDRGRVFSLPGSQYRVITTAARLVPSGLLQRLQQLGR